MSANEEVVLFDCHGDQLIGILHHEATDAADGRVKRLVVINVVGGPQYRVGSHRQFVQTARYLSKLGHASFRFDYRGMGDSDGESRDFLDVQADIDAAITAVRSRLPGHLIVLMGLCDGASAILMHLGARRDIAGIALMNPWVRTEGGLARAVAETYYGDRFRNPNFWRKLLKLEVNVISATRDYLRNRKRASGGGEPDDDEASGFINRMQEGLARFDNPALLVLSGNDLTASEFNQLSRREETWSRLLARSNVEVRNLSDADHTFSTSDSLDRLHEILVIWLESIATRTRAEDTRFASSC